MQSVVLMLYGSQVLLSVLIGPPLISAFTYLLLHSGPWLVVYVWVFMLSIQLLALTVYPTVIAPMFNKFEPLPEGPLRCAYEAATCEQGHRRLQRPISSQSLMLDVMRCC